MRMFATARQSIDTLAILFQHTARAREEFEIRRQQIARPRQVQMVVVGRGMIQLRDTDTGTVLGFRKTYREACNAARALENGRELAA